MTYLCKDHIPVSLSLFSIQLKLKQYLPGLKTQKNQLGCLLKQKKKSNTIIQNNSSSQTASTSVNTSISSTKQTNRDMT
jgi:hypothetical protein